MSSFDRKEMTKKYARDTALSFYCFFAASLSFFYIAYTTVAEEILAIPPLSSSDLLWCAGDGTPEFNWDTAFFESDLPFKYESIGRKESKWWAGPLSPEEAWTLLEPSDYMNSHAAIGDFMSFVDLFRKVESKEEIHIVVMGGSITEGSECGREVHDHFLSFTECSWVRRLEIIFHALGLTNVKIFNLGIGGNDITMASMLLLMKYWRTKGSTASKDPRPIKEQPDAFVLAYSSNDEVNLIDGLYKGSNAIEAFYEEAIRIILSFEWSPKLIVTTGCKHT